ncbi:alpha/beta hydrolase family protein (plasmid) [Rhizobium etli bv. mimosae str. IE4771]|uniref:Alpha/beta hydrolase family protein n=1 Tax=Rhizobium etli bv. mimosae str. IE4771 TaxID=1432050 RepID=A0A060ICH6_RHIET|nr:alpha/beta hydrolase [Rhizobium sp. IE4771]AIC29775.1 alpha/beta hydrolase family protein [Rhizobium sp. IE4771]
MKTDLSSQSPEAISGHSRREALRVGVAALAGLSVAGLASPAAALASAKPLTAATTQFIEVGGRKLAYQSIGTGKPIVLAHRFRGVLGLWDPAFINALASQGFQVVTFDYSGMGLSTGEKSYNPMSLLKDTKDLIDGLGLKDVVIGGWSYGAIVAEIYVAMFGASVSHAVLIAGVPPGKLAKAGEQRFLDVGTQGPATLDQYTELFFEPNDPASRAASKQSFERIFSAENVRSPDVPADWAKQQVPASPPNPVIPSEDVLNAVKHTNVPILHLNGDHDISFPVENWYALNGQFPTLSLITYPRAGHGAHFQYPELAASQIAAFIRNTKKV